MSASQRTVVITGSSSGIGAAIAKRFSSEDGQLVLHGRKNLTGLWQEAAESQKRGRGTFCIVHDFSKGGYRAFVDAIFHRYPFVDVWINAAGADVLTQEHRGLSFEEKLNLLWLVDVKSTIHISRMVAEKMKSRRASGEPMHGRPLPTIINVGWDQAERGMEGESGQLFCPIKSAIMSFTRSLARSVGPDVRVNGIAPGWIQTAWGQQASREWDERAKRESSLARWGRPEDCAEGVYFLASAAAEFVNGQFLEINGGWKPMGRIADPH